MEFAQHKRMPTDHLLDNFLVFLGGFLISLTHPFNSALTLLLVEPSLFDAGFFVLRSLLGGALALIGKVAVEWCIKKYKSRKTQRSQ